MDIRLVSQSSGTRFNSVLMLIDMFIQKPKENIISHSTLVQSQRRKRQEAVGKRGPEECCAFLEGALECLNDPHPFSGRWDTSLSAIVNLGRL